MTKPVQGAPFCKFCNYIMGVTLVMEWGNGDSKKNKSLALSSAEKGSPAEKRCHRSVLEKHLAHKCMNGKSCTTEKGETDRHGQSKAVKGWLAWLKTNGT